MAEAQRRLAAGRRMLAERAEEIAEGWVSNCFEDLPPARRRKGLQLLMSRCSADPFKAGAAARRGLGWSLARPPLTVARVRKDLAYFRRRERRFVKHLLVLKEKHSKRKSRPFDRGFSACVADVAGKLLAVAEQDGADLARCKRFDLAADSERCRRFDNWPIFGLWDGERENCAPLDPDVPLDPQVYRRTSRWPRGCAAQGAEIRALTGRDAKLSKCLKRLTGHGYMCQWHARSGIGSGMPGGSSAAREYKEYTGSSSHSAATVVYGKFSAARTMSENFWAYLGHHSIVVSAGDVLCGKVVQRDVRISVPVESEIAAAQDSSSECMMRY